jgi:hypothetical protein
VEIVRSMYVFTHTHMCTYDLYNIHKKCKCKYNATKYIEMKASYSKIYSCKCESNTANENKFGGQN